MSTKILKGTAHFKIQGTNYDSPVDGGFDITYYGGQKYEAEKTANGNTAITSKQILDQVSGDLYLYDSTFDPTPLVSATDVTITIQLVNGSVFVLRNAVYTGEGKFSTKEGTFAIQFDGNGTWMI